MKKILLVLCILALSAVAVLAALPFVVDLNRHKGEILELLGRYTERRVDFERVDLTVLTGIGARVRGLRVSDDPAFSRGDFLDIGEARVKVALLPLLAGRIEMKELAFVGPRVSLVRDERGVYNFASLLRPRLKRPPGERKGAGALPMVLLGAGLVIRDGGVVFVDRKKGPSARPVTVGGLDLETDRIDAGRSVGFKLSASLLGEKDRNLKVRGKAGPMEVAGEKGLVPFSLEAVLDPVRLGSLPLGKKPLAGVARVRMEAEGALGGPIRARLRGDLSGAAVAEKGRGASGAWAFGLAYEPDRDTLTVTGGTLGLGRDTIAFSGGVDRLRTTPYVNATVASRRIEPGPLLAQLGLMSGSAPGGLGLAGPASFRLSVTGTRDALRMEAQADMAPMALRFANLLDKPARTSLAASARIAGAGGAFDVGDLEVRLGPVDARGSGRLSRQPQGWRLALDLVTDPVSLGEAQAVFPVFRRLEPEGAVTVRAAVEAGAGRPLSVALRASSGRLNVVLARPKSAGAGGAKKAGVLAEPVRAEMKAVDLSVDAVRKPIGMVMKGRVFSKGGVFMKVPYSTMEASLALEGSRFTVPSFRLNALKGSMKGSASYDLKTKAWDARPVFSGLQASDLMDTLTGFKGVFAGGMSGEMSLGGVAGRPAVETLAAKGRLAISDGQWKNFDLAGAVLGSVLGIPGASGLLGIAKDEVKRYDTTRFKSLQAEVDLTGSVIRVDSMKLLNIASGKDQDTESHLKGTISMETQALDLEGTVVLPKRFSQKISAKSQAFRSITDGQGRIVLPLSITGGLRRPVPMVDVKVLGDALTRYYTSKAIDSGLQRLQEKGRIPAGSDGMQKALEEGIEGLFRKKK